MKKNPKREASRKVSSQRKKKTKAESLVPEIVVTKHSDYPLFPLKAAFLGRYLLIFFGALGINLVIADALGILWDSSYLIAPIALFSVLFAAFSFFKKSRIPIAVGLVAVLAVWFAAGKSTPVDFALEGVAGLWNRMMAELDRLEFSTLPEILPEYEGGPEAIFWVLSLVSVTLLTLFTVKKVRFFPCALYLIGICSPAFLFQMKMENLSVALVLAVLLSFAVTAFSQKGSSAREGAGFLGLATFLIAAVLLFYPVFRFELPMVNLTFIQSEIERIELLLEKIGQGSETVEGNASEVGTGSLLQTRKAAAGAPAFEEKAVLELYTESRTAQYLRTWIGAIYENDEWEMPGKEEARRGYSLYRATVHKNRETFYVAMRLADEDFVNSMTMKKESVYIVPLGGGELMAIPVTHVGEVVRPTDFSVLSDGIWVQAEGDHAAYSVSALTFRERGGFAGYRFCELLETYLSYLELEAPGTRPEGTLFGDLAKLYDKFRGSGDMLGVSSLVEGDHKAAQKLYPAGEIPAAVQQIILDLFRTTDIEEHFQVLPAYEQNFTSQGTVEFQGVFYRIREDIISQDAVARLVSEYLRDHYRYTLSPNISEGASAMEAFLLKAKEGYCVQFATAGTLILRGLGLTARYAEGYVASEYAYTVTVDEGDTLYKTYPYVCTVLDSDAHAWTEIWLEGFGWQSYEMTPGFETLNRFNTPYYGGGDVTPPTTKNPEQEEPDHDEEDPGGVVQPDFKIPWGAIALWGSLLLVLLLMILGIHRFTAALQRHRRRRRSLLKRAREERRDKTEENSPASASTARELVDALTPALALFVPMPKDGELPSDFASRVGESLALPEGSPDAEQAVRAMMMCIYRKSLSKEEIELLADFLLALTKKAKAEFSFFKKVQIFLIRRIL